MTSGESTLPTPPPGTEPPPGSLPPRAYAPPPPRIETPPSPAAGDVPGSIGESDQTKGAEWPNQAADFVVETVDKIRDLTTSRALTLMRAVVYGTAIAILATMLLVLFVIATIRVIDVYLPGEVWSAYLLLGSVFTIVGLILWSKRRASSL